MATAQPSVLFLWTASGLKGDFSQKTDLTLISDSSLTNKGTNSVLITFEAASVTMNFYLLLMLASPMVGGFRHTVGSGLKQFI